MKKPTIQSRKRKLWPIFSRWIRVRDARPDGRVVCVTCGAVKHWSEGDAGHFLSGRGNAILFEENGVHFQCKMCNGRLKNRAIDDVDKAYREYMIKRYGLREVRRLEKLRKTTRQFTCKELQSMINFYSHP